MGLAVLSRRAVARGGSVRRTVLAEAVLGVVVLGVTAALADAAPARVAYVDPVDVTVPGVDGGQVQVYDTGSHRIHGVAQAQSSEQTLTFSSQELASLPYRLKSWMIKRGEEET